MDGDFLRRCAVNIIGQNHLTVFLDAVGGLENMLLPLGLALSSSSVNGKCTAIIIIIISEVGNAPRY
jgi:hypothetical protein